MAKFDQDIFREKVREILKGYKQEYKKISEPLINKILKFINQGESVYNAVTMALAETSFFYANSQAITDVMFLAACAGYGVSPSIITATSMENIKDKLLSESWTGDKMKLSKRLHGSSKIMRQNIIDTISSGMRKSLMLKELAMKLYNGYNSKQGVLNKAEIPKYLEELRRTALMVANGDVSMLKDFRKALENAEANIKTLNSKNLKATYNELLSAAKKLNEKAINRTVRSAIEEKTRYHAERIARTETVRAWFDGFIAENQDDSEVFGYRWVLSSRHKLVPFDQCDVCANMNVGYGKGIYPKNKVPSIPRHPHCMCMLEVVYTWEIDVNAPLNPDGAREYIDSLNEQRKNSLFGIDGAKAYKQGKDWQKLLRGWDGFGEPKSRLKDIFESERKAENKDTKINKAYLSSADYRKKFYSLSDNKKLNRNIYIAAKTMLKHRSGSDYEDLYMFNSASGKLVGKSTVGEIRSQPKYTNQINKIIESAKPNTLIALHNHPSSMPPSDGDLNAAMINKYKQGIIVGHDGKVFAYTGVQNPITALDYKIRIAKHKNMGYNVSEFDAQMSALEEMSRIYGFTFKEVK